MVLSYAFIIHTNFSHGAWRKLFMLNWPKTQGQQWPQFPWLSTYRSFMVFQVLCVKAYAVHSPCSKRTKCWIAVVPHTAPLLLQATASYQDLLPGRPSTIGRARALSHALEQVVGKWCTLHLNPLLHFCGFRICFVFFNFSSGTNTCKIITPKIIVKYS